MNTRPTLSTREREHAEAMVDARDAALAAVRNLGPTDQIQVLVNAAAKAITLNIGAGGRIKAVEIAQRQIEENVRKMLSR